MQIRYSLDKPVGLTHRMGTSSRFVLLELCDSPYEWGFQNEHRPAQGKLEADRRQRQGKVGKLTDNDWQVVEGKRDQLVGRIQAR